MKKLMLLAFMSMPVNLLAQPKTDKASVEWGPELDEKSDGGFGRLFGQNDEAVYMTMSLKKDLLVQKMNGAMTSLYKQVVDMEINRKDLILQRVMLAGSRVIILARQYDKKEDMNRLYMRMFNEADMRPSGPWEVVAQFSSEKAFSGGFETATSPNEEHILITIHLPYEKDGSEKFQLRVYDKDMVMEWEREVVLPYADKEFRLEDLHVDNDGDVIAVGVKYAEKREARAMKRAGKVSYVYHLITYSASGDRKDHAIAAGDRFLQDLTLSLADGNGPILCGGFYGVKGTNKVRGAFFMSLHPETKAIMHESYKEFSDDMITQYMTAKEEEKARKKAEKKDEDLELFEYDLDEIIRRDDGGAVLVGEQYYMYTTTVCTTNPNGGQSCRTVYHYIYNDIIVVNIDPSGDIAWATTIPKRQHTSNDDGYFSSYALEVKGSDLYFIFNDNGENLFRAAGDKFKQMDLQGKGSVVTMATVTQDGHVTREALFDPEKRELILRPKSCVQLADDRMFLYATRRKDYRFGIVTFQ